MPERPKDLIYALDERPPPFQLLALGFQHVAVICPYLVMVALVAGAAKLPHDEARNAMGLAMIAVAFLTVLQSLRLGRVGSGYLCPPVVSAIYLPSSMTAASTFGFPVACGMVIFAGACEALMAQLLNKVRKLFPAVVSGVVIIAVGIELGKIGLGVLFEDAASHDARTERMFATAFCVLVTMTVLAVWAKGLPRLLCALTGILVGYALSALLKVFPEDFATQLSQTSFFAVPDPRFLSFAFEPSLMIPFAIAGLASGLRVVGVLTTCQQMNDASWRRPDMKNIEAGVVADGIGCAVGGALGAPGMSASPSLVGIEKTTGATSRVIAWSIAGWLVLLACFPKFASLIVSMPRPVMAAALFFNGSLMFVAGIQIVASRPITLRASLIVGFSILTALSIMIFPEFYKSLPAWTHQFTASEITVAVIVSVALNAIFLLGTWRYSQLRLGDDQTPLTAETFDDFFVKQAKEWKIPEEDVKRVRSVVDEAIEQVSANAQGPVEIRVGSDNFDVSVSLKYVGNLPALPDARPKREMVEEQSFVSGLTGYLSGLHADRVERSAKGEECEIKLLFRL
ncbi:MAG TPA: solute carrier family 23 protein [Terrimicrobiaceae bacterium]